MVRMFQAKLANLRKYGSRLISPRKGINFKKLQMELSKYQGDENLQCYRHWQACRLKVKTKAKCTDRIIGTRKAADD